MVEHTLRILKVLSQADTELSLRDVSARAGAGRTSTFRILFTLGKSDYVRKNPDTGKYRLSAKLLELAWRAMGHQRVVPVARPFLQKLHKRFNETVNLAVFQDGEIVYVEILESSQAFRVTAQVGTRVPFHSTALGKAIAAFLPEEVLLANLAQCSWTRFTPHTITSRAEFLKALSMVRQHHYSRDDEETEIGATCVGAPILDHRRLPVAAISLSGPTPRLRAEMPAMIRGLKGAAAAVSKALGSG